MVEVKSKDTLLSELRTFSRNHNRDLDVSDNSLAKDLLLLPYSIGGEALMDQVAVARDLAILSKLNSTQIDDEATNYKKERLPGTFATVTLTFYSVVKPTATIVIPANTQASTAGSSFVSPTNYSTIADSTFPVADANAYYSYDRDRYEFSIVAICTTIGSIGNISSNLITKLSSSVPGISGVTNLVAATGGSDQELDDDFRSRIQNAKTGRDLNTVNGLRGFLKDTGFIDAYPVRVEDIDSERSSGIDAFVINQSYEQIIDIFTYDPAQPRYYFTKRPVIGVTSVVGSIKGTLSLATDYDVYIDNAAPMRRSVNALDYISFRAPAALNVGEAITVTYNYASQIKTVQDMLGLNDNNILTASTLIKRAYPEYLNINARIVLTANADGPATRNKLRSALSQLLSNYRLGDDIQKSDLIVVLQEGYGDYPVNTVDYVVINSYYLRDEFGNVRQPVDEVIVVGNKEYVVYGNAILS